MRAPQLINYAVNRLSYSMVSTEDNTHLFFYVEFLLEIAFLFEYTSPLAIATDVHQNDDRKVQLLEIQHWK